MENYQKDLIIKSLQNLLNVSPSPGLLLLCGKGEDENLITIGWIQAGIIWNEPCINVFIRKSRYSYQLLQKYNYFTLNVVPPSTYNKVLDYCSKTTGYNCNKFKDLGLEKEKSQTVETSSLKIANLVIECSIISRIDLNKENINSFIYDKFYSNNDYHQLIIGKILYVNEKQN